MSSLGRRGEAAVFCFISDFPTALLTRSQTSKSARSRGSQGTALPPARPSPGAVTGGGRDLREAAPGREGRTEGGRAAQGRRCLRGSPRLPADGVRLAGLRLRGAGGGGRCGGLRQGRQRPVASCRSSLRRLSGTRRVPAIQRSKECVAFPRGIWHLVCCYGNEILQLQKGDARDNCRCQFIDGRPAWIADDGKTYSAITLHQVT